MNKFKQTKQFFILILMGLLIFSCQKEEVKLDNSNVELETDVSFDLAKTVALNYVHDFFGENTKKI